MIGGMILLHFADADAGAVAFRRRGILFQRSHKPQPAALDRGFQHAQGQPGFLGFQGGVKVLYGAVRQGHDRFHLDIALLERNAGDAGQDQQLAESVPTAEVDARVAFGQPGFLRAPQQGRKGNVLARVIAENLVQRAGDDRLDGEDLVAAVGAFGDGVQHRKGGAHRRFVAKEGAGLHGRGVHGGIFDIGHGEGTAVRRHDGNARIQQVRIAAVEVMAARTVDKNRPLRMCSEDFIDKLRPLAVGDVRDADLLAGTFADILRRLLDDLYESRSDGALAGDIDIDRPQRHRLEEFAVQHLQGPFFHAFSNRHGNNAAGSRRVGRCRGECGLQGP